MNGLSRSWHRIVPLVLLGLLLGLPAGALPAAAGSSLPARQKPGPTTIRGIAAHVHSGSFTLETRTKGSYTVAMSGATSVVEKGQSGQLSIHEGDHVGVRGFVQGRQIRAISVRIYPVKPKAYSVKGTITSIQGSTLVIAAGGKTVRVVVNGQTSIRIGSNTGAVSQMRVGDRVDVRVQPGPHGDTALHIHVYRKKVAGKDVRLRGTVASVTSNVIAVKSGANTYRVSVSSQTTVYVGSGHGSLRSIKAGQQVTVYACCAGQALTAHSIHLSGSTRPTKQTSQLLRGTVTSLSTSQIGIVTSGHRVTIALQSSTVYELGSTPTTRTGVRIGDDVSVRVSRSGSTLTALRVHVYPSSRRSHAVTGVVAGVNRSGLVVVDRGKRYTVNFARGVRVTLGGNATAPASIHTGDHVHAVGQLQGSTLVASQITVRRPAPKHQTVRGTIVQVSGSTLVIADAAGAKHQVRLAPGDRVTLHGKPAPSSALFPGASVTARGTLSGNVLVASKITVTVRTKNVKGRVVTVGRNTFVLSVSSGAAQRVDLPTGLTIVDTASHGHSARLAVGAYVQVQGYVEQTGAIRATSVSILHPTLDVSATVIAAAPHLTIQTTRGDRFILRFPGSPDITVERVGISLAPNDIPTGARVHVQGTVQSDGTLLASQMTVRLSSETIQGSISAIGKQEMSVQTDSSMLHVRLLPDTIFEQGSHTLTASDLVVGDDVTVYGYSIASSTVLARKLLVHRKLTALDGTVASLTSDGFMLTAADGPHRVIMSSSTIITGGTSTDITAGAAVHVTGYQRGDGVILATRVRIAKTHTTTPGGGSP